MKHTQSPGYTIKKRIFEIIQIAGGSDAPSRTFDICIMTLILLSIAVTTAQTFHIPDSVDRVLNIIDAVCMAAFTAEYALRLWTADLLYPSGRMPYLKYIFSLSAIIDLLSFLPFYLSGFVPAGMVVFRLIRVARILRLFRINHYLDPVQAILTVLRQKASLIFASWFLVFVLMFSSSLLMYYVEHDAQPSVFENAFSGLWWAVSTLSTTGYGDIYPVTFLGKTLAIIITLLGMCIVAIPTGIITAGFMEAGRYSDPKARREQSPRALSGSILDISTPVSSVTGPSLIDDDERGVAQLPMSYFIGPCIVETVNGEIHAEKIGDIVSKASGEASRRIILRGDMFLSEEAASFLADFSILLLGFSQKASVSTDNTRILLSGHMVLLSGINVDNIDDGEYLLHACPIHDSDAASAPCRAYLMPKSASGQ